MVLKASDMAWALHFSAVYVSVGALVAILYFPLNIGNVIIPIDEIVFFRGVAQTPTSYVSGMVFFFSCGMGFP